MALTQRLQMRQSQALVMTPQLMQAIKLLQLSNLDLVAYVEGELEKNPLLERAAEGEPGVIDGAAEPIAPEFDSDTRASGPDGAGQRRFRYGLRAAVVLLCATAACLRVTRSPRASVAWPRRRVCLN